MPDGTIKRLAQQMGKITMQSADRQMAYNTATDTVKSKWAIVAHPGACAWCIVYSSRGWEFNSEKTAKAQRHANCTCAVVADSDASNPMLSGYDPDGMRDRYRKCAEAVGSSDASAVVAEMSTRDREWLRTGKPGAVSAEVGAVPLAKETATASVLATSHGFNVQFIKPVNKSMVKTADAILSDGSVWEFKVPEAYNSKTVKNQFKKALGKGTGSLLISGVLLDAGIEELCADVSRILASGEFAEITEVLVLSRSGELRRLKR